GDVREKNSASSNYSYKSDGFSQYPHFGFSSSSFWSGCSGGVGAQMAAKYFFLVALVAVLLVAVLGAPKPVKSDEDLKKSVVEFLKQDREFMSQLRNAKLIGARDDVFSLRNRRQAETEEVDPNIDVDEKPGFFDRAAKFIVDLLQRFLKWINSDSN
ncbi:hypothetical protein NQ315_006272, partial [Exocentrus adspersus]